MKRADIRITFAFRLPHQRGSAIRTAETSMPFNFSKCSGDVGLEDFKMVPLSGINLNRNRDKDSLSVNQSDELFKALDEWNSVLERLLKPSGTAYLPKAKARDSAPPRRRRHKKMGGAS